MSTANSANSINSATEATANSATRPAADLNLAVLAGRLSSAPDVRELESGSRLATLQVRVPGPGDRATSVPVAWWDPPAAVGRLDAGDAVVVTGRVQRRFFPVATGGRGSRVEVVAETVHRASERKRAAAALGAATDRLTTGG